MKMIYESTMCQKKTCEIVMTQALNLHVGPQGRGRKTASGERLFFVPALSHGQPSWLRKF